MLDFRTLVVQALILILKHLLVYGVDVFGEEKEHCNPLFLTFGMCLCYFMTECSNWAGLILCSFQHDAETCEEWMGNLVPAVVNYFLFLQKVIVGCFHQKQYLDLSVHLCHLCVSLAGLWANSFQTSSGRKEVHQ